MSATAESIDVLAELDRLADVVESFNEVATRLGWAGGFKIDSPVPDDLHDYAYYLMWAVGSEPTECVAEGIADLRAAIRLQRRDADAC